MAYLTWLAFNNFNVILGVHETEVAFCAPLLWRSECMLDEVHALGLARELGDDVPPLGDTGLC